MKKLLFIPLMFLAVNLFAGENVSSIGAGKDYTTLDAWQTAKMGDITGGNSEVAEIYEMLVSSFALGANWVTDADSKIILRAATSARHNGTNIGGPYAGLTAPVDGILINISPGSGDVINMDIDGLVLITSGAFANSVGIQMGATAAGSVITIKNNIIDGGEKTFSQYGIYSTNARTLKIYNNIIMNFNKVSYATGFYNGAANTCYLYNNTFINNDIGARAAQAGVVARNNLALRNSVHGDYYTTTNFSTNSLTNISSDSTADNDNLAATGGIVSKSTTSCNITAYGLGAENFHIASDSGDAYGTGTDVYSDANLAVTSDIDYDTLTERNDIGADEYSVGGGEPEGGDESGAFGSVQYW